MADWLIPVVVGAALALSREPKISPPPPMQPSPPPDAARWIWPVVGGFITDVFGWRVHPIFGYQHLHDGIDIGIPMRTPVRAVAFGTVVLAGWNGGYGRTIKIEHPGGVTTLYGHLDGILVAQGQIVGSGEAIAVSGNTGNSTGPHLHFGVYLGGEPVDPMPLLPGGGP